MHSAQLTPGLVHLIRGPAELEVHGRCNILGKIVSDQKIIIKEGKVLPFETESICKVTSTKDIQSWTVGSSQAGISFWIDLASKVLQKKFRRIMLIGNSDAGKSTLAVYLINRALEKGLRTAVVDSDMGQGDLAPPTAIGASSIPAQITDLSEVKSEIFEFVGSTSPSNLERQWIAIRAINRLMHKLPQDYDICVINTDGYVNDSGIEYKFNLAMKLKPDAIILLGEVSAALYSIIKSYFANVMIARSVSEQIPKSRPERIKRRLNQFILFTTKKDTPACNILSKKIVELKITYMGRTFSRLYTIKTQDGYSIYPYYGALYIRPADIRGMFVGLGTGRKITGFGIISEISSYRLSVISSIDFFDSVHFSNCRIERDLCSETRIFTPR